MGQSDDLAGPATGAAAAPGQATQPGSKLWQEGEIRAHAKPEPHPWRVGLSHITIGDLIVFSFKLMLAGSIGHTVCPGRASYRPAAGWIK